METQSQNDEGVANLSSETQLSSNQEETNNVLSVNEAVTLNQNELNPATESTLESATNNLPIETIDLEKSLQNYEERVGVNCKHIQYISIDQIRRVANQSTKKYFCGDCASNSTQSKGKKGKQKKAAAGQTLPLHLLSTCLGCGAILCGETTANKHMLTHTGTSKKDKQRHCLFYMFSQNVVWCTACMKEVSLPQVQSIEEIPSKFKPLAECIELLSSLSDGKSTTTLFTSKAASTSSSDSNPNPNPDHPPSASSSSTATTTTTEKNTKATNRRNKHKNKYSAASSGNNNSESEYTFPESYKKQKQNNVQSQPTVKKVEPLDEYVGYSQSQVDHYQNMLLSQEEIDLLVEKNVKFEGKGLVNNGNTCYFNATLQCLLRLPLLRNHFIPCTSSPSSSSSLEGGESESDNGKGKDIGVIPYSEGTVSSNLRSTFFQVFENDLVHFKRMAAAIMAGESSLPPKQSSPKSNFNPQPLLHSISKKSNRFRGNAQQDAHELLRYLLDLIRTEEMNQAKYLYRHLIVRLKSIGYDIKLEALDLLQHLPLSQLLHLHNIDLSHLSQSHLDDFDLLFSSPSSSSSSHCNDSSISPQPPSTSTNPIDSTPVDHTSDQTITESDRSLNQPIDDQQSTSSLDESNINDSNNNNEEKKSEGDKSEESSAALLPPRCTSQITSHPLSTPKLHVRNRIEEIFEGHWVNSVTCHRCGKSSYLLEPFFDIFLSIPSSTPSFQSAANPYSDDYQSYAPRHNKKKKNKRNRGRGGGGDVTIFPPIAKVEEKKKEEVKIEEEKNGEEKNEVELHEKRSNDALQFKVEDYSRELSLDNCVYEFTNPERLFGECSYVCDFCNSNEASSSSKDKESGNDRDRNNGDRDLKIEEGNEERNKINEGDKSDVNQSINIEINEEERKGNEEQKNEDGNEVIIIIEETKNQSGGDGEDDDNNNNNEKKSENEEIKVDQKSPKIKSTKNEIKTNATKQILLMNLPEVLTIVLKRFAVVHTKHGSTNRKVDTFVHYPLTLNLSPFMISQGMVEEILKSNNNNNDQKNKISRQFDSSSNHQYRNYEYQLIGITVHSGGCDGGHYVAYVNHRPHIDESKHEWYYYSDTQKHPVSAAVVFSQSAYLLFYHRLDLL